MHYLQKMIKETKRVARRLQISEVNRSSAEAAFYMIGSTVPLLALSLVIAGRFFPLEKWLDELPFTALLPDALWDGIARIAYRLSGGSSFATILSLGAVLTLWSAASGMRALCRATVRLSHGTEMAYAIAVFRGLMAAILVPIMLGIALGWFKILGKIGGFLLLFPTLLLFCICLIRIFLKNPISWRILLGRAALAAVAWEIFSLGFRIYLSLVPRTSYLYGGIGAVLLFLIYLRACLWIFLVTFPLLRDS